MSQTLARWQAVVLGIVVVGALGLGGFGLARIATKQGLWAETFELAVGFPEVHDVAPGTPVRLRGVDAGQVVAVDYPDSDEPGSTVTLRLRLDARFAARLHADAAAQIHSTGLLGAKVIALAPGTPAAGPLASGRIAGTVPPDLAEAAAKLRDAAAEAEGLIRDVRQSNGTLAKLLKDDDLYRDAKELATDARGFLKRADGAVGAVEAEVPAVRGFVRDGQDTLRSIKAGTDAIQRMPLIRDYVEDAPSLLVRPDRRREAMTYRSDDLFEPGTAFFSDAGRVHLGAAAQALKAVPGDKAEVVVAAFSDPNGRGQTAASARELTRKQAEAVVEFFRGLGVHKLGWVTRRKISPLGMGMSPSPVVDAVPQSPSRIEVVVFSPP